MIVIADKPGQLGNMLFLFSHFIGRALESNLTISNPAFDDYADRFPTTARDLFCRFPARQSPFAGRKFPRRMLFRAGNLAVRVVAKLGGNLGFVRAITLHDWVTPFALDSSEFIELARQRRMILVRGWLFRDVPSLRKHAQSVKKFFQPHETNQRNIAEVISRARRNSDILIGVHVRQGIIQFANTRKYFYPGPSYVEMMDELTAMFPGQRVSFLICSDWPQDPELFSRFDVTFGTGDLVEDMYAFARCDYLIGPPSTFTMWASFYGDVPLNVVRSREQRLSLEDFSLSFDVLC
jgi:hypothetical protein